MKNEEKPTKEELETMTEGELQVLWEEMTPAEKLAALTETARRLNEERPR